MTRSLLSFAVTLLVTAAASAQDREYIQALERAQRERPAPVPSRSRIAPETEPGTPLVVQGRLFDTDGAAPVAGAVVFAYQTDREGLYNAAGSPAHAWRLKGWAATDAQGRFEFRTIRPGAYPGRQIPSHVHFTVFLSSGERYHAGELQFEDDRLLPESDRERSRAQGSFGSVRPVKTEGGTQHVTFQIRLDARQKF
jgi:protocatechuate 3,4-dioxygenase beta subunit